MARPHPNARGGDKRPKSAPPPRERERPQRQGADDERIIPVAVLGLGHVGRQIALAARAHPRLELVGALDRDSNLVGKPLGALLDDPTIDLTVARDLASIQSKLRGGVLLIATTSRVDEIAPQLEAAFKAGLHVVSSCEELAYPWLYHDEIADRIDAAARRANVCAVGTGVNPGFVLDRLVAAAGACTGKIVRVQAERVVDARNRRNALLQKVGAGLSEDAFDARAERDEIGHVGLAESCALAALGLGLDCDEVEEELAPVIAEEDVPGVVPVKAGQVAGVYQSARGFSEGREVVRLELTIAAGAEPAGDHIHIEGEPNVDLRIEGGMPGEAATAWAVVNCVPSVVRSEPGLLTVLDLPSGR
ncbi:MAG: dihydrodipicolinate reductase [Deltaproteobacteria bacterium]|nr:dihydrodipicolinate reductase [Deltaproteobacteria bacterium]